MASVSGSRLAFYASGASGGNINVVLTPTDSGGSAAVSGNFNVEVFTSTAGALAVGYDASAFIQDAVATSNNEIQAGTLGSTEQVLDGSYTGTDETGDELIIRTSAGSYGTAAIGGSGDTITGSMVAGTSQLIDGSIASGTITITGAAGATTVWIGFGDTAAAGAMLVDSHSGAFDTIVSGASNITVLAAAGDSIVGGGGAFSVTEDAGGPDIRLVVSNDTEIGKSISPHIIRESANRDLIDVHKVLELFERRSGESSIIGGSGTTAMPAASGGVAASTFVISAVGNTIVGDAGTMLVAGGAGLELISGGNATTVTGLTSGTTVEGGNLETITGNTGALLVDITANKGGAEIVNLTAGPGVATLGDIAPSATTMGATANTSVSGFATATDLIASTTSVSSTGTFLGTSSTASSSTTLTFVDGTTMTLPHVELEQMRRFTR